MTIPPAPTPTDTQLHLNTLQHNVNTAVRESLEYHAKRIIELDERIDQLEKQHLELTRQVTQKTPTPTQTKGDWVDLRPYELTDDPK